MKKKLSFVVLKLWELSEGLSYLLVQFCLVFKDSFLARRQLCRIVLAKGLPPNLPKQTNKANDVNSAPKKN